MSHEADRSDPFAADPVLNDRTGWRADTLTSFPAITDATPPPAPAGCPCQMPGCPDGPPVDLSGSTAALLSCAPGVTGRMWRTRIANGEYDDIPSLWDDAHAAVHKPALREARLIHAALGARRHDIATVYARRPDLLTDRVLAEGLHDLESRLASRLEEMQAEAAAKEMAA